MAAVPAIFEEPSLEPRHALRVEVALELGGQAQLAAEVAAGRPVEAGTRQVRHEQGYLAAFQFVEEVEHEPGVAGKAGEVVRGDRGNLARRQGA